MSLKIKPNAPLTQTYFISSETAQKAPLLNAFPDLLISTLSQLNKTDVHAASLSCKTLYRVTNSPLLWKNLFERDFSYRFPTSPFFYWKEQYRLVSELQTNLKSGKHSITPFKSDTSPTTALSKTGDLLITSSPSGTHSLKISDVIRTFQQLNLCEHGEFCISSKQDLVAHHYSGFLNILSQKENGEFYISQTFGNGIPISQFILDENHLVYLTMSRILNCFKKDPDGIFQNMGSFEDVYRAFFKESYLFIITTQETIEILKEDEKGNFQKLQDPIKQEKTRVRFSWISYENGFLICAKPDGTVKILKKSENGIFADSQSFGVTRLLNPISTFMAKDDIICCGLAQGEVLILKNQCDGQFNALSPLKVHNEKINAIEWNGRYLLTGSVDGVVNIWKQDSEGNFQSLQALSEKSEGNLFPSPEKIV